MPNPIHKRKRSESAADSPSIALAKKSKKEIIPFSDLCKLSHSELAAIMTRQLLEGNETYLSLWIGIMQLFKQNPEAKQSLAIRGLIDSTILDCEQRLAEKPCPFALVMQGLIHQFGLKGDVDNKQAISYFEQAIARGYPAALTHLAYLYENLYQQSPISLSLSQRFEDLVVHKKKVDELYQRAIKQDEARAMMKVVSMKTGMDKESVTELTQRAFDYGNAEAIYHRGEILERTSRRDEALKLYEKAVEQGSTNAMNALSKMHTYEAITDDGTVSRTDYAKAIFLSELGIKFNNKTSESHLLCLMLHTTNTSEVAHELLDLIWDALVCGRVFTDYTTSLLKTYCQDEILKRLTDKDSVIGTRINVLKKIKKDPEHTLRKLLGDKYPEFLEHIDLISAQRAFFFRGAKQVSSSLSNGNGDVMLKIMSFAQPGFSQDYREWYSTSKPTISG